MNVPHLDALAARYAALLAKHYERGFGISPAAEPHENFYRQVWARDFSHAAAHYFIYSDPQAVEDSLSTIFRHQRADGSLPFRVEKEYLLLKLTPGLRFLARPLFRLIEGWIRGRVERPVYSGEDFSFAEDTVPAVLLVSEMYRTSGERGETFMAAHGEACARAREYFTKKCGPDGFVSVAPGNVDWADSVTRGGKLGLLNVLWARAAQGMHSEDDDVARTERALLDVFYDRDGAFFRTAEGERRLDTVATILGALFFLDARECVRVEEALKVRMTRPSGLGNFDPPYPPHSVRLPFRLIGHGDYHNAYVWPWVSLQNIHVKIKIAQTHPEEAVREQYKQEAVGDLYDAAALFENASGAYEIFFPDSRKPADTRWYHPPRFFLASLAGFMSVYRKLLALGWLEEGV
ncbi:hypothetical protein A3C20_02200 [Candidatus Kaiserbacteria bacterium RIFCSPHIGHO2_02_FULL_55_25]|uniref:Uncharacterized protein n=1 Tax=Candidatus Kaiserbacteria bacterium RIFCSPHIGHO2_02_FULL_55_25 TaxID=1798498 RepID=A0A1F6E696_9BACT|nr:MAG: hypothetical protein A2764_01380 [Candidatus Kaiserbacteria bacterium RIFCSPHIGHO2_01_FULL_55_79]OGG68712.1 MAG: hypothetical protein A3C20_02200 [Candidatus Kaiserbacteria bacterium RIFCSPHIGHO2_02_FULL_55_25]OGG77268.1 MAG: hypothetical protein A3F56_04355 [Candidatus Kaiserbacteria bacterium RIFCSPHIGHO2_12_FULL_55_13]OGG82962.1 MAG: hypothetical protein A3A42_03540 [Candidatus Kaiserbacteria bacterium RIFCSPLOWO2_01_FULL_55_25]